MVGAPQIDMILKEAIVNLDYEVESLFRKDSLDIRDSDRQLIVDRVTACPHQRIIITHGTDTMVDTAKALQHIDGKTIIITGAMQPASFKQTDAVFNVGCAVSAVQILPAGVYIVMSGRVFNPDNARKNLQTNQYEYTERFM